MKITIGHFSPDTLNLYGARGNVLCMKKRLQWRGIDAEIRTFDISDPVDFTDVDIVFLGGGSLRDQSIVCKALKKRAQDFRAYVEDNGVLLAICGGYQMIGNYYDTAVGRTEGLSLVNIYTHNQQPRLVSNAVIKNDVFPEPIVGFENHAGRTEIGNHTPFGTVLYGYGNNGESGAEGLMYRNIIGTYLHGPLLPKNPHVCDHLLEKALHRKDGIRELAPLEDTQEQKANQYIVNRFVCAK